MSDWDEWNRYHGRIRWRGLRRDAFAQFVSCEACGRTCSPKDEAVAATPGDDAPPDEKGGYGAIVSRDLPDGWEVYTDGRRQTVLCPECADQLSRLIR